MYSEMDALKKSGHLQFNTEKKRTLTIKHGKKADTYN